MIVLIVDIFLKIRAQKRTLVAPTEAAATQELSRRNKRIHNQMIILMLVNVIIFFATTLSLTFDKLIASFAISGIAGLQRYLITSSIFNWILSLNFAITFYIHCLSSSLFRNEFLYLFNIRRSQNNTDRTLTRVTAPIPLKVFN